MPFPPARYPASRQDPIADDYHGVRVADPYRWLEDAASAATETWTREQNALTRLMLDTPLRRHLRRELQQRYDYPRMSAPVPRGRRGFFTRNSGLQPQPVLYCYDASEHPTAPWPIERARPIVDPNVLSDDGTVSLSAWKPSPDGRLVAYALSSRGSDWQELRVRDVERGVDVDGPLLWTRFVTIAWFADSRGFHYPRFQADASYHPFVCAHRLGTTQAEDRTVLGPSDDPDVVYDVDADSDGRLVVTASRGASDKSEVIVLEGATVRWTVRGFDDAWRFLDSAGGDLFLRTDCEAPRGRIVAVDPGGRMRTVVPESEDSLADAIVAGGRIAARYLRKASSVVRLFDLDGRPAGDVSLPELGSVTEMHGEAHGEQIFLRFASFTWPPAVLRCIVSAPAAAHRIDEPSPGHAPERYETQQVWYPSRDGTPVSMFLVRRRDAVATPAGVHPVWLTGYGGFGISLVPDFDPAHFVWLDRGGVLAVPNLRGGGEYGEAWHEAGMRERKQTVFDDCIAALEWLIGNGWTDAGRVVIEGGSNGGLLVSAVLTQRPDLAGAVVCRVPVTDMLRYHRFTIGRYWIPEYGCADEAADFAFLYAYSPLHRVRDDVAYPPVLITTADTDDRVDPGMARKLAARLQAARGGPALIRIETRAGHGAGKPVAKMIEEDADIYAFALIALGLETSGKERPEDRA